jgi:hypothetical protein
MNIQETIITIVVGAISVAISFYLKDFMLQKQQYKKLRAKLEKIAGKNARVIYGKDETLKITEIDESGVTLENDFKTIFVPTAMLLQTEMILPSDKYDMLIKEKENEKEKRQAQLFLEEMKTGMPTIFNDSLQEQNKMMREVMEKATTKMGEKKDPTNELLSMLMQTGSIQPPDPVQLLAMRFAKMLANDTDTKDQTKGS